MLLQFKMAISLLLFFLMQFISVIGKAEFSASLLQSSVLQSSVTWSFIYHSDMLIWCSLNISSYYQGLIFYFPHNFEWFFICL